MAEQTHLKANVYTMYAYKNFYLYFILTLDGWGISTDRGLLEGLEDAGDLAAGAVGVVLVLPRRDDVAPDRQRGEAENYTKEAE